MLQYTGGERALNPAAASEAITKPWGRESAVLYDPNGIVVEIVE